MRKDNTEIWRGEVAVPKTQPEMRKEPGNTHLELTLLHFLDPQPGPPLIKFNKKPKCKEVHWFNLYWTASKGREKKGEEKADYDISFQKNCNETYHTQIHLHTYLFLHHDFFVSRNLSISAQINFLF